MIRGKRAVCRILVLINHIANEVAFSRSLSFELLSDANDGIFFFHIAD